jgi:FixJ family two-component response regulator
MEQRFKNLGEKKQKIYRYFLEPSVAEKKRKVIELHKQNMPNEYIAAELALSHTTVMKVVKEYRDNHI